MTVPERRTLPVAGLIVVAALAALDAQRGGAPVFVPPVPGMALPQRTDDPPVFRSGVTLIQMDVFVTDAAGEPVTGLTAEDFEVIEAGQPRSISSFAAIDLPIEPPVGLPGEDDAEPDVATNAALPGRTYVFALDEVNPARALRARDLLRQFIDQHLGRDDQVSVVLTGRGLADSGQDFTGSRRLLLQAIDKFSGGFPDFDAREACGASSDARQLASSLRRLTEFLATLPGRKALVYVGEGLGGLDIYELQGYRGWTLTPAAADAHAALAAATRGNVTIYPVDPCGLTPEGGGLDRRMDLRALAELTGGFAVTNTNNFAPAFADLVRENSRYYTIGFDSGYTRRDGRFVRVDVRVTRPGLQVRARSGYMAPIGRERPSAGVRTDAQYAAVGGALASAVSTPGVPLQVFAAPYRAARGRDALVALAVEIGVAPLGLVRKDGVRTGDIEVSYLATDSRGRVRPGRRHAATLAITSEATERAERVRLISQFSLRPGRYQIRVAAGTAATAGSVVADLEVPDFSRGPLTMSGVFLTSDRAATVTTLQPVEPLPGALPGPPTARRDFDAEETLGLFVEVYENTASRVPRTISVTTTLRGEDGRVVPLSSESRSSSSAAAARAHRFTAHALLAAVPAGAYVLEVEGRTDLAEGATVTRRIPIRVR